MKTQSISQVSKQFHVSARTLRYYEAMGLISPMRDEENAYRIYDEDTLRTLRQIMVLRKLRIPLKQIASILKNADSKAAIAVFEENLAKIENEITALSTIRGVIVSLLETLQLDDTAYPLLDDENLLEIADALTETTADRPDEIPEQNTTIEDLHQASENLNRLTDRDVRIVYLPPAAVAAAQYYGDGAEEYTGKMIDDFAKSVQLHKRYPASRHFGFNAPNPIDETGIHGYERWITIPDDMEVPAPLVKKQLDGGLYAAYMIPMGAFEEWGIFFDWAAHHEKFDLNIVDEGNGYCFGLYEEHLNWINYHRDPEYKDENIQLDLLIALKPKPKS